jgi:hypothetical protein
MFSEIQKAMLIEARKCIEKGKDRFICCAINVACQSASDVTYDTRWSEATKMKEQIDFGIDGYSCLDLWLFSEMGIYPDNLSDHARKVWDRYAFAGWQTPVTRETFDNLCLMARLAWLDRALENGVLS